MAKPKRTPIEREHDLLTISRRYLAGDIQADIAIDLGLSQQQISYDLKELQRRWLNSSVSNLDEAKARELAKVDNLELEYWQAWKRSQEDAETVKQKGEVVPGEGGKPSIKTTDTEKTTKGQAGDPRFLQGVQWCIERRCKILGVDAPEKHDLTTGGEKITLTVVYKDKNASSELPDNPAEAAPETK